MPVLLYSSGELKFIIGTYPFVYLDYSDRANFYTGKTFDFPRLFFVYCSQSFFVHCPYKGLINRAKGVLTGLKPY